MSHYIIRQIRISTWNVHGLGDKINDNLFLQHINSDINILLETWKGTDEAFSIPGYNCMCKIRKKNKRARRPSGGILILYKNTLNKGITHIKNGTKSNNRMWIKLNKTFFGLNEDVYLCAVYIPPINSNHFDNDFSILEEEINFFSDKGNIILAEDLNARTGAN